MLQAWRARICCWPLADPSSFLAVVVRTSNKFTGMDMEDPDSDKDVEYATLFEIVGSFKKLGFRPLSSHILFGHQ